MGKLAFVFPGQGSAAVGMGEDIARVSPGAAHILEQLRVAVPEVDRIRACGPRAELVRTAISQPTIYAVDCACFAALAERGVRPDLVAGHSLGEYAALVAAGALDFSAGLSLVLRRGELMEEAARLRAGTMIAVLGLEAEAVAETARTARARGTIAVANDNAPGQIVLSGDARALEDAGAALRARGGRVMALPVGGAFHSPLMETAERGFLVVLDTARFATPTIPVVSNVTASISEDAASLKAALRSQITGSVRWRESVETMLAAGVDRFVEVGPGKVLSGLIQRCARGRDVRILNVEDAASLERTIAAL